MALCIQKQNAQSLLMRAFHPRLILQSTRAVKAPEIDLLTFLCIINILTEKV